MKYFSVPADFKNETIDKYYLLNNNYGDSTVMETYGNITVGNAFGSGRTADTLSEVNILDLERYVNHSRKRGMDFNYTINATHLSNREFDEDYIPLIIRFLHELYDIGVQSLTVTLPSLIEIIKSTNLDFKIKASSLCQVTNPNKAVGFKTAGADRLVVEESVNRDFSTLKRIREAFGERVEVIANVVCLKDCIYRSFHYNQMSCDSIRIPSEASLTYYPHRCIIKRYENLANVLRLSWIRPEDIGYYTQAGINYFKLQGRKAVLRGDPVRAVTAYFKGRYDGNLMDLLDMFAPTNAFRVHVDNRKLDGFIEMFANHEDFCRHSCDKCKYCDSYAAKSINYNEAQKVIKAARNFYEEFDQMKQILRRSNFIDNAFTEDNEQEISYERNVSL